MKVLLITGEDFSASSFENKFKGTKVSDIINNLSNYDYEGDPEDSEEYWELSALNFGDIDPEFVKFIRQDIQDYDMSKDTNFYLETETI